MNILKQANSIVNDRSEEKEREYGPFSNSMSKASLIASELTGLNISTEQFYLCMVALKMSRMAYNLKEDTLMDCAAYIGALNNFKNGK